MKLKASHSFQVRTVSGLVEVVKGKSYDGDHPAVRHRPDWFTTPVKGTTPSDGEDD